MARRPARPKPGSVYAIRLSDGDYAFGQVCAGGDFAFFDWKAATPPPEIETVVEHAVAFRIPVAVDAPAAGHWELIGSAVLHGALSLPGRYKHRPVGSPQVFLYTEGRSVPSSEDEVKGFEVLATWFSNHVEQRLEDHFAGRPNKYAQSLELR